MNTCKLTDMCCIQYGYAFDSASFTEDATFPPLVRIRDVKRGFSETYYSGNYAEKYIVRRGDILIGMDGEFNIARWQSEDALLNQRVCKIIPKQQVDASYILFALTKILKKIEDRTAFVTVKHLSAKELNKIELRLPNYEKQVLISSILEKALRIINHRRTQLAKLDELIKCRFIEMFGSVDYPLQSIGMMSDVVTKGTTPTTLGFEFVADGVNFVKVENITATGQIIKSDLMHITSDCHEKLSRSQLMEGDILFSIAGAIGRTAVVTADILPANTNQALAIIRLKKNTDILKSYLLAALASPYVEMQYNVQKKGVAQINLTLKNIADLMIPVPSKQEQERFVSFVEQIDKFKFAYFLFTLITVLQKNYYILLEFFQSVFFVLDLIRFKLI